MFGRPSRGMNTGRRNVPEHPVSDGVFEQGFGEGARGEIVDGHRGAEIVRERAGTKVSVADDPAVPVLQEGRSGGRFEEGGQQAEARDTECPALQTLQRSARCPVRGLDVPRPPGWRRGGCGGTGRGPGRVFPPHQGLFVAEAEAPIHRPSEGSGIETDAGDAASVQMLDGLCEEGSSDASVPVVGEDEHHADPGQFRAVNEGGGGSHGAPVPFRDETAFGFERQESAPIAECLIPSGGRAKRVGEGKVVRGKATEVQRVGRHGTQP